MKRLVIFRHAKAVPHSAAPDFDRALNARGLEDARATGAYLATELLIPDLALVSPALRTRQTWEQAAAALSGTPVRLEASIYDAETSTLLKLVRGIDDTVGCAILVGHNPGLAELAELLTGHGDRYAFARLQTKFPTSAVAVIDIPADSWAEAAPRCGRLDRFVTPEGEDD